MLTWVSVIYSSDSNLNTIMFLCVLHVEHSPYDYCEYLLEPLFATY